MTEAQKEYIDREFIRGEKSVQTIADEVGLTFSCTRAYIGRAKKKGELPNKRKKRAKSNKPVGVLKPRKHIYQESTLAEGECVNCTEKVAKTCLYGFTEHTHQNLCEYFTKTGKLRTPLAPNPKKCTVYVDKRKVKNNECSGRNN